MAVVFLISLLESSLDQCMQHLRMWINVMDEEGLERRGLKAEGYVASFWNCMSWDRRVKVF